MTKNEFEFKDIENCFQIQNILNIIQLQRILKSNGIDSSRMYIKGYLQGLTDCGVVEKFALPPTVAYKWIKKE